MTAINDIVLIYFEGNPLTFARVEAIDADIKRDWYHVKLLMLQMPLQVVTWILRDAYINGEPFTMEGKQVRLERIVCPEDDRLREESREDNRKRKSTPKEAPKGKIISLEDLKKK